MSDQQSPAAIAREAKSIHQGLKDAVKKKDPYERDIDFQRKDLRRRYLALLLVHPYAKESQDVDTHLWLHTSHAFISSYKMRISALDRQMQQNNINAAKPVEYRKLIQRFRQFLADEDKFWTKLVLRFRRSFALDEAHSALVKLGLVESGTDNQPEGRNHYQFPPETHSVAPSTPEQRASRLSTLSKALVCLGDIARYREVYNDGGGRSKIGQEDTPRRARTKRGGGGLVLDMVRPRNYSKARSCYEQAKFLVPTDGNPSHQLAILASYEKDHFMSLVHYYFALCVKQPYDPAYENMETTMSKALEQRRARAKEEKEKGPNPLGLDPLVGKVRIDNFKDRMVVLHALWQLGQENLDHKMQKESHAIYVDFKSLLQDRHLLEEFIPHVLVSTQGALWTHRMHRGTPNKKAKEPLMSRIALENHIFDHLSLLHRALFEVGAQEVLSVDTSDADLAPRISAPFRRTLGALRMTMKWLRANMKIVVDHGPKQTAEFWNAFTIFIETLGRTFPISQLPELTAALDEDREMEGFVPLNGLFIHGEGAVLAGEHPNVVHLMRISDILKDAHLIADYENSPFVMPVMPSAIHAVVVGNREEMDDEVLTETTDDPVAAAFDHLKEQELDDDDDEEEVLYPRASVSPKPPVLRHSPQTPVVPMRVSSERQSPIKSSPIGIPVSPVKHMSISPLNPPTKSSKTATTAQDLLFSDVLGSKRPMSRSISGEAHHTFLPSESRTIWSAASDESLPMNTGRNMQQTHLRHPRSFGVDGSSQSGWPTRLSSLPPSQNSQSQSHMYMPGTIPSATFALPPQPLVMDHLSNVPSIGSQPFETFETGMGYPSGLSASLYQDRYPPQSHIPYPPSGYAGLEQYYSSSPTALHTRHVSLHDPRQAMYPLPTPSMWGPTG